MVDPKLVVNINKANVEDFERIPGIGRSRAQAIIEHRSIIGEFTDIEDVRNVSGFPRQLLEAISNHLVCTHCRTAKQRTRFDTTTLRSGDYARPISSSSKLVGKRKIEGKLVVDTLPTSPTSSPIKKPKPVGLKLETCSAMLSPGPDGCQAFPHYLSPSCAAPSCTVRRRVPMSFLLPPESLYKWLDMFQKWTSEERAYALDALIESCDMSLVRHLMAKIEPQFQRDFISLLPKELALYVLAFLEPRDLCKAAQTCRYWRILAEDNLLWREKCKQHDIEVEDKEESSHIVTRRRSSQALQRIYDHVEFFSSPFKRAFLKQHTLEMNWRFRPLPTPKLLKGHDDHVITCLQFDGNRIVSGSDDNTLKVWSAITGTIIRTLVGHTGGVWSSQLKDNVVVSGSTDRTLRIWNADTGTCLHVLYGHTSTVRCLAMHKNTVVSGSRDGTLRVWDITRGECLKVLVGHSAAVRCVQFDGKRVVSGAYDYVVKVWDPDTETCLHTLSGHTNRVYSLQFDGTHIVSGSLDTSIRVWDAVSGELVQTLIGHQSLTSGMVLKNNTLVSGNADSTVKVWDIVNGQCRHTLAGPNKHQSAVTSLQFNNKFVVTSSDDGSVKLWDLRSGEFVRDLVKLDSGGSGGVVWRVKCNDKKLVCAVGSRNGTEETKLLVLDFDAPS